MIAVVDDSVLGAKSYVAVREFLRKKYIIEAVVSLPGDAFQRSKARVKTSVLVMRKKEQDEEQPPVFMAYATAVGLDDSPRERALPDDMKRREDALNEASRISKLYRAFLSGDDAAIPFIVPASRILDRMDVKSCLPVKNRLFKKWVKKGVKVSKISELVDVFSEHNLPDGDVLYTSAMTGVYTYLRVRYDGIAEAGEEIEVSETEYPVLLVVHAGDIVVSHINAVHGAIAIVPAELDGCVISPEYTLCRPKAGVNPEVVWLIARSPNSRAELLLSASGMGRTRVDWSNFRNLTVPVPDSGEEKLAADLIQEYHDLEAQAAAARAKAEDFIYKSLLLKDSTAMELLAAFKPPQ